MMKVIFAAVLLTFSLAACSSLGDRSQSLQLGMSELQVKKILGGDYRTIASRYSADGQPMTVWEYKDQDKNEIYWVYLKGGKLIQWGTPSSLMAMPEVQSMNLPSPAAAPATR